MSNIIFELPEDEDQVKIKPTPRPKRRVVEELLKKARDYRRKTVKTTGKNPSPGLKEQMAAELLRMWDMHGDGR